MLGLVEFLFEKVSILVSFPYAVLHHDKYTKYLRNKRALIYIFEEKVLIIEYLECECDHNFHILHITCII